MILRKIFWFLSVVLCFGLISVSAQNQVPKLISGGVVNGKAISLPKPEYPAAAAAVGAKGAVNVEIVIDEQGNVESASAVSGHPLLRAAAVNAARQAQFAPTTLSGVLVKVKGVVIYNFNLSDRNSGSLSGSGEEPKDQAFKVDSGDGVVNSKAISLPKPAYPAAARAVRAGGAVNVRVKIDEQGNVIEAEAVSGHPLLRAASVAAAREAKFNPTTLDGNPVTVTGIIIYNYTPSAPKPESTENSDEEDSADSSKIISGGVLNGRAISLPKPSYPLEAKEKKASGTVNVEIIIDEQGNVESATAVSGDSVFYEACEKAAIQAKFTPTLLEGNPVRVRGVIIYNFIP